MMYVPTSTVSQSITAVDTVSQAKARDSCGVAPGGRYLMSKPGHVVSAEELLEHVWDENADPFTQTVRVTVGTLRRKLSVADEPQLLETVVGRGYRLREEPAGVL